MLCLQVTAHYVAMTPNGKVFDSSLDRGFPYDIRVGAGQVGCAPHPLQNMTGSANPSSRVGCLQGADSCKCKGGRAVISASTELAMVTQAPELTVSVGFADSGWVRRGHNEHEGRGSAALIHPWKSVFSQGFGLWAWQVCHPISRSCSAQPALENMHVGCPELKHRAETQIIPPAGVLDA
jgi:hypothetical protein